MLFIAKMEIPCSFRAQIKCGQEDHATYMFMPLTCSCYWQDLDSGQLLLELFDLESDGWDKEKQEAQAEILAELQRFKSQFLEPYHIVEFATQLPCVRQFLRAGESSLPSCCSFKWDMSMRQIPVACRRRLTCSALKSPSY